jgi:hypothetical protein
MKAKARTKFAVPREVDLEGQVEQLADLLGWKHYHTRRSTGSNEGFPDLLMIRRGRMIAAELKTETGQVKPKQQEWLDAFSDCIYVETYLWRPSDLDRIGEILR